MKVNANLIDVVNELENGGGYETLLQYTGERSSYFGELFSLQHEIFIEAQTACCATNPHVSVPVHISQSSPAVMDAPFESTETTVHEQVLQSTKSEYQVASLQDYSSAPVYYGGSAVEVNEENEYEPPSAPPLIGFNLETMMSEMKRSVYDLQIVQEYVAQKHGQASFITTLTGQDISSLLVSVYDTFARKQIACVLFDALERPITVDDMIFVLPLLPSTSQKIEMLKVSISLLITYVCITLSLSICVSLTKHINHGSSYFAQEHREKCSDYDNESSIQRLKMILSPLEQILLDTM